MKFDAKAFLAQHADDPIAALNALEALRDEAQTGRDKEGQAAATARKQRDDAKSELAAANDQLLEAKKNAVPEGGVVLTGDDATAWQALQEKGGRDYLTARLTRADEADKLEGSMVTVTAAQAHKVDPELLTEWLAGRGTLTSKKVTEDGKEVVKYGLTTKEGDKEVFKALDEFATFKALPKSGGSTTANWPDNSKPASGERQDDDKDDPIGSALKPATANGTAPVISPFSTSAPASGNGATK